MFWKAALPRTGCTLSKACLGSGKTTLAFQFLREGVRRGERALYVALSETEEETRAVAKSHGWSLDGIFVRELVPTEEILDPEEQYTMFHPSEVELSEATKRILTDVEEVKPRASSLDSLSELHLSRGTRCATGGRCSRSSISLQPEAAPCCCWMISRPASATCKCKASRTA